MKSPQNKQKVEYVLGFAFRQDHVLLMRKKAPDWQRGRLNGLGGHIERKDFSSLDAMQREAMEEAGILGDWKEVGCIRGLEYEIILYACNRPTMTITPDRDLSWYRLGSLPYDCLDDVPWLAEYAAYALRCGRSPQMDLRIQ